MSPEKSPDSLKLIEELAESLLNVERVDDPTTLLRNLTGAALLMARDLSMLTELVTSSVAIFDKQNRQYQDIVSKFGKLDQKTNEALDLELQRKKSQDDKYETFRLRLDSYQNDTASKLNQIEDTLRMIRDTEPATMKALIEIIDWQLRKVMR